MFEEKIKDEIAFALQSLFSASVSNKDIEISRPDKKEFGDYSTNVSFKLAKELGKAPNEIAGKLAENLDKNDIFEKVEAAGGFVNIYLKKEHFHKIVTEILEKKEKYGNIDFGRNKKAQVEYLSANPTGPVHVGNARGIVGETIANVLKKASYNVETEYYVNDIGGQTIKFAKTLIFWFKESLGEKTEFPEGGYPGDYYKEISEKVVKKVGKDKLLAMSEDELVGIFQKVGLEFSVAGNKETINKLGVSFDKFVSQSEVHENYSEKVFEKLQKDGFTQEKEGAVWFAFKNEEIGEDKESVLARSDEAGTYTYFMDDIAYHWDKFCNRKFDLVIDVWGSNHYGHIVRMKEAMRAIGVNPERLQIVIYQYVRLKSGDKIEKMAKRKGTYVTADQVLDEVSSDIFKFFLLMRSSNTHLDFDLELAKDTSEKNPVFYVKYAFARLSGILKNAKDLKISNANLSLLVEPEEIELIDQLSQLESVIRSIVSFGDYPVQYLPFYAIEVARKFHSFYDKCRVIDEENLELTAARLKLVEATQIVLRIVMEDLIGIEAPERM